MCYSAQQCQFQVWIFLFWMCVHFRVSVAESSALKALQEKLFARRSELMAAFQQHDLYNTGKITQMNDLLANITAHSFSILLFSLFISFLLFHRQDLHQWMGSSSGISAEAGSSMAYFETTSCAPGLRWERRIRVMLWKHWSGATHAAGFTSRHICFVQAKNKNDLLHKYIFKWYEYTTYYGQVRQIRRVFKTFS